MNKDYLCVDMLRMLLYYTRVYTHARTRIQSGENVYFRLLQSPL